MLSNFKSRDDLIKEKLGIKKVRNLHLMMDNIYSGRFIEFINEHFNKEQHFFIFINSGELKYIEQDKYDNIVRIDRLAARVYFSECDKIFLHYLDYDKAWLVNNYEEVHKFYWVLWGADLYSFLDIELYTDVTKKFVMKKNIKGVIGFSDDSRKPNWQRETAMKKIPYILTNIKGDYELVKSNYNPNAKLIRFSYPNPINFISLENRTNFNKEKSKYNFKEKFKHVIFVGNSGFTTNNHIEIIYALKDIKSKDFCLVLPLAYGREDYIAKIIKEGKKIFGEQFIPITEYLKPTEYFCVLNQVDVAIMNHKRQQGMGTIKALLYLGKKLFMDNEVTSYSFFEDVEIKVYPVNSLKNLDLTGLVEFPKKFKEKNKRIIHKYFSEESVKKYMKKIF